MVEFTRQQLKAIKIENERWPDHIVEIPFADWPAANVAEKTYAEAYEDRANPLRIWRSKRVLAVLYMDSNGFPRLSVNRTDVHIGGFMDNISWDDLMEVKRAVGYGDTTALEVYPRDTDIVNVANMRHLWLMEEVPSFVWRNPDTVKAEELAKAALGPTE